MEIRIAGPGDFDRVLAMFDGIVEWLASLGRTGQWGTTVWSANEAQSEVIRGRIERRELRVAEDADGTLLGALSVTETCSKYVSPPPEPELFVSLLGTSRAAKGRNVGGALLEEARAEARRRGLRLLRLDCYNGDDGKLREWYLSQGLKAVEPFTVKRDGEPDWPGMLLAAYLD